MTTGTCIATHRTNPDRPPRALGGLLLCAGHFAALTEALTGPSAADDPTLDAVWGVRQAGRVRVHDAREQAAKDCDQAADYAAFRQRMLGAIPRSWWPELVCGDGQVWHDPRDYRPGQLARDYATLTGLAGHVTASAAHVSGSADPRLPINPAVADLRDLIAGTLASWARVHVEEMPTTPPATGDPATVSAWLARYVDWSAAQPWVNEYLAELTELHSRARAQIDLPRPRRIDVAPCVERPGGVRCDGRLSTRLREDRDPTPPTIDCDTCEASYSGERWLRLSERIQADARRMVA